MASELSVGHDRSLAARRRTILDVVLETEGLRFPQSASLLPAKI